MDSKLDAANRNSYHKVQVVSEVYESLRIQVFYTVNISMKGRKGFKISELSLSHARNQSDKNQLIIKWVVNFSYPFFDG